MSCNEGANRGVNILWFPQAPNYPLTITVSGTGSTRNVALQTLSGMRMRVDLWLSDDADNPNDVTGTKPSESKLVEWVVITDEDGAANFEIKHVGVQTWQLFAEVTDRISNAVEVAF